MSDLSETFFTSIGCMDGRVQNPVAEYGKAKFNVLFPDTITEAGLVGTLANNPSQELLDSIKKKVLISVEKHHSKGIVVHGHQECAGNPIEDEVHKQDVLKTVEALRLMVPDLEIKPVFVVKTNGNWTTVEL
jgi:carbonic anhydrase